MYFHGILLNPYNDYLNASPNPNNDVIKMSEANAKNTAAAGITDPIEARQHKLAAIRAAGFDPYPYTFPRSDKAGDLQDKYAALENGAETTDTVAVAGRIMAMRNNGLFIDLMDASGKIQ
ncbi:MAG: hypothetical protein KKA05_01625, partial [Alphaproteobacteria bacterium]|nr:hypothetical protein [Alphaproteobacteria bacterium]